MSFDSACDLLRDISETLDCILQEMKSRSEKTEVKIIPEEEWVDYRGVTVNAKVLELDRQEVDRFIDKLQRSRGG